MRRSKTDVVSCRVDVGLDNFIAGYIVQQVSCAQAGKRNTGTVPRSSTKYTAGLLTQHVDSGRCQGRRDGACATDPLTQRFTEQTKPKAADSQDRSSESDRPAPDPLSPGRANAVFLFLYFLFSFFTKIYFRFRNLQEYTPAAQLPGGRHLVAPLPDGRDLSVKNFVKKLRSGP